MITLGAALVWGLLILGLAAPLAWCLRASFVALLDGRLTKQRVTPRIEFGNSSRPRTYSSQAEHRGCDRARPAPLGVAFRIGCDRGAADDQMARLVDAPALVPGRIGIEFDAKGGG